MSKTTTTPKPSAAKGKSNSGETIRFKVGDTVKAESGRTYCVEKIRSDCKLQGREQKKGKPYGPTRVFAPGNVTQVALATSEASAKPAAKKKPVKKTPARKTRVSKRPARTPASPSNGTAKKQPGCLEAAAKVLAKSKEPLSCKTIMERILDQKLWSTVGKTPHQTLSSAIQRDIAKNKKTSRFVKAERGLYAINPKAPKAGAA